MPCIQERPSCRYSYNTVSGIDVRQIRMTYFSPWTAPSHGGGTQEQPGHGTRRPHIQCAGYCCRILYFIRTECRLAFYRRRRPGLFEAFAFGSWRFGLWASGVGLWALGFSAADFAESYYTCHGDVYGDYQSLKENESLTKSTVRVSFDRFMSLPGKETKRRLKTSTPARTKRVERSTNTIKQYTPLSKPDPAGFQFHSMW